MRFLLVGFLLVVVSVRVWVGCLRRVLGPVVVLVVVLVLGVLVLGVLEVRR